MNAVFTFNLVPATLEILIITGCVTDYDISFNSTSGGMITALLIFALEKVIINGALGITRNESSPLEPEPFIATNREEIIAAAKSKYCPMPTNIDLSHIYAKPEGQSTTCLHVGECKGQGYSLFFK